MGGGRGQVGRSRSAGTAAVAAACSSVIRCRISAATAVNPARALASSSSRVQNVGGQAGVRSGRSAGGAVSSGRGLRGGAGGGSGRPTAANLAAAAAHRSSFGSFAETTRINRR